MSKRSLFVIAGSLSPVLSGWSCHHRTDTAQSSPSTGGGRRGGAGGPGAPVPVVAGKVEQKDVPIFLDGLGTVQAFNTVTVRPRVDGELHEAAGIQPVFLAQKRQSAVRKPGGSLW